MHHIQSCHKSSCVKFDEILRRKRPIFFLQIEVPKGVSVKKSKQTDLSLNLIMQYTISDIK